MKPFLRVLSEKELNDIHLATVEILEKTGVLVEDKGALGIFQENGCQANHEEGTVKIPYHVLVKALDACSPAVTLYCREGLPPLRLGGSEIYFGLQGQVTTVLDWRTSSWRETTTDDLREACRLAEVLESVTAIDPPCAVRDVSPPELQDQYRWMIPLMTTRKHIINPSFTPDAVEDAIAMASEIAGSHDSLKDEPFISFLVLVESPLAICKGPASIIVEAARAGLPVMIEAGPLCGASSPGTLVGTMVTVNAVVLAAICLAKLTNPKAPVIYASWARTFDMRSGSVTMGSPEFALMRAATAQLARYYGLPAGGGGGHTEAKTPDAQMGYEKLATLLVPALSGIDLLLGMSLIQSGAVMSLEALVIEDELAKYTKRILQGIDVDAERIGLEVIAEKGPRGSFLNALHTRKFHRQEMWIPEISDREFGRRETLGGRDSVIRERARQSLEKKLAEYRPPKVSDASKRKLKQIVERRRQTMQAQHRGELPNDRRRPK